jgi:hypothetical protein
MMPNKTYELRNLYFEQVKYKDKSYGDNHQEPVIKLPDGFSFSNFIPDIKLIDNIISEKQDNKYQNVSEKIFGKQLKLEYFSLKHLANLVSERAKIHKSHIDDIDAKHIHLQKILYGVEINHTPDRKKMMLNLEGQLLQLEGQRRDEELAFWKDTAELREKIFEKASEYKSSKQRYDIFNNIETDTNYNASR